LRRAAIVTVRCLIVLLLLAAARDVPLPRRSGDRVRIHLVDRSGSVSVRGPAVSLRPANIDAVIAYDRQTRASGDLVTWASFGKTLAWESDQVDPSGSDVSLALTAALARNPTEIILYSDGRWDPGNAAFLFRDREVPIHVCPLGPTSVRDVRFRRVQAPASVRPGDSYVLSFTLESTYDVDCSLRVDQETRPLRLVAGVSTMVPITRTAPGVFHASIDVDDDCPENNKVDGQVFALTDQPRILALSKGLSLPGVDLDVAQSLPNLGAYDAIVLDNIALPAEQQQTLATWVKGGRGLVLLGGPLSYARGDWPHRPVETLSPLTLRPDLKVAAVFGLDSSGSMKKDFDLATQTLLDARDRYFDADDDIVAMTFADEARTMDFDALRKVTPTGGTRIARAIVEGIRHLRTRQAGRKVIVLVTDGESAAEETPEMLQAAIAGLDDIALIVLTTRKDVPGARNLHMDWNELDRALRNITNDINDLAREAPGILEVRKHPVTAGISPVVVRSINRTTAKSDSQVLATVGQPPKQDPVLAIRSYGEGRVAAFTTEAEPGIVPLIRQALDYVVGDRDAGLSLSIDPPRVIAQGVYKDPEFVTDGVPVVMKQVASNRWEGRLPEGLTGSVVVGKGRARATATIACPPEYEALGVDRDVLDRLARDTGGRLLRSTSELETLPRPERTAPRSGRTVFLLAAMALVFVELGVSIYWKV